MEQMESIRKTQANKTQEVVNEGKKIKKVGDSDAVTAASEAKVGQSLDEPREASSGFFPHDQPPAEFTQFCPTDQEEAMMDLLEGPDAAFFEDHDCDKPVREVEQEIDDPHPAMESRLQRMAEVDQAGLTEGYGEQLQTFLKNQLLLKKERNPDQPLHFDDVRKALERARSLWCPSLAAAADEALQGATANQAGSAPNTGHLSKLEWDGPVGRGILSWEGGSWDVWDFGDKLYPTGDWPKELLRLRA